MGTYDHLNPTVISLAGRGYKVVGWNKLSTIPPGYHLSAIASHAGNQEARVVFLADGADAPPPLVKPIDFAEAERLCR